MEGWTQRAINFPRPSTGEPVRINYISSSPPQPASKQETILLIHGFPLTSRQFQHVLPSLAKAGYHVIAPDYTGAGGSSKPVHTYAKSAIAADLLHLMDTLLPSKTDRFHVVAHDIGGTIGHALVSQHPERIKSAILGECPIPGTSTYEADSQANAVANFHFQLHHHPDLAVALITGREEVYLRYFFEKQAYNTAGITDDDVAAFVKAYSQPGALRAVCLTYKAFGQDVEDNVAGLKTRGLCKVPVLGMAGARSHHAGRAEAMLKEMYETVEALDLEESGHYMALENPEGFSREVLKWVGAHV